MKLISLEKYRIRYIPNKGYLLEEKYLQKSFCGLRPPKEIWEILDKSGRLITLYPIPVLPAFYNTIKEAKKALQNI